LGGKKGEMTDAERQTMVQQGISSGDIIPDTGPSPKAFAPTQYNEEERKLRSVAKILTNDPALDAVVGVENTPRDPYAVGYEVEKAVRGDGNLYNKLYRNAETGEMEPKPVAYGLAQLTIKTARAMPTGKNYKHYDDQEFIVRVLWDQPLNIQIAKEFINRVRISLRKNKYARKLKPHEFNILVAAAYNNSGESLSKKITKAKPRAHIDPKSGKKISIMEDLVDKLKLEEQTLRQIRRYSAIIGGNSGTVKWK
jgi:hypothetical protein